MHKYRKYLLLAALSVASVCFAVGLQYGLTPQLESVSISPRNVYRLEFYDVSPLQRIWHHDKKIPSFVRLYRIKPETLMAESDVVDMWINGQLYWYLNPPMNKIRVGRDVVFENIPPECTDCPPLTDRQIMP